MSEAVSILINGETHALSEPLSLQALVNQLQLEEPFALAVNGRFVPRRQAEAIELKEGDAIELLSPIQGG